MARRADRRRITEGWLFVMALLSLAVAIVVALYGDNLLGRDTAAERPASSSGRPEASSGGRTSEDASTSAPAASATPTQLKLEDFVAKLGGRWRRTPADRSFDPSVSCAPSTSYSFSYADGFLLQNGPTLRQMQLINYGDGAMFMNLLGGSDEDSMYLTWNWANPNQLLMTYSEGAVYYGGGEEVVDIFERCP